MIAFDTSVLVRIAANDDPAQVVIHKAARDAGIAPEFRVLEIEHDGGEGAVR